MRWCEGSVRHSRVSLRNAPGHNVQLAYPGIADVIETERQNVRFRLWAPHAAQVEVILDHPVPGTTFTLAGHKISGFLDGLRLPFGDLIQNPGKIRKIRCR